MKLREASGPRPGELEMLYVTHRDLEQLEGQDAGRPTSLTTHNALVGRGQCMSAT